MSEKDRSDKYGERTEIDQDADQMMRLVAFGIEQAKQLSEEMRRTLLAELEARKTANPEALDEHYPIDPETLEFIATNIGDKIAADLQRIKNKGLRAAIKNRKPGTIITVRKDDYLKLWQKAPYIGAIHQGITKPEPEAFKDFSHITLRLDFTDGFKIIEAKGAQANLEVVAPEVKDPSLRKFTFIRGRDVQMIFFETDLILENPALILNPDLRAHVANRRNIVVAMLSNDKERMLDCNYSTVETNGHANVQPHGGNILASLEFMEVIFDDKDDKEIITWKRIEGYAEQMQAQSRRELLWAEQAKNRAIAEAVTEATTSIRRRAFIRDFIQLPLLLAGGVAAHEALQDLSPGYRKWWQNLRERLFGASQTPQGPEAPGNSGTTSEAKHEPKPEPKDDPRHNPSRNGNEIVEDLRALPGIEGVFAASLRGTVQSGNFTQDNLLNPYDVSRHFLGNRFQYTGMPEDQAAYAGQKAGDAYTGQRIHRFTAIGSRSKFLGKDGEGAKRFESTTLADAINNLLDYSNPQLAVNHDYEIRKWIVWTYQHSFDVKLDINRLKIKRDRSSKKVTNVTYNPPKDFDRKIGISIYERIQGIAAASAEAQYTRTAAYFNILADDDRLLLQSGISPNHDLYVPEGLLDHDKEFTIKLPQFEQKKGQPISGDWKLSAEELKWAIDWHETVRLSNPGFVVEKAYGEEKIMTKVSPYVPLDDGLIRNLANFIVEGLKTDPERVQAITNFVQALPYIGENDRDFDRHPLLSLFNQGSDCNNLTVIWSALMAAKGYEHYLLYVPAKPHTNSAHLLGAVPAHLAPNWQANLPQDAKTRDFNGAPVVELTGEYAIGTTHINDTDEIMAGERFKKVNGKWEIKKIKKDGTMGMLDQDNSTQHASLQGQSPASSPQHHERRSSHLQTGGATRRELFSFARRR